MARVIIGVACLSKIPPSQKNRIIGTQLLLQIANRKGHTHTNTIGVEEGAGEAYAYVRTHSHARASPGRAKKRRMGSGGAREH